MDNKLYDVRRDDLEGEELLLSLPNAERQKVELAIAGLAHNPWPEQFSAKNLSDGSSRIAVSVEDDEITVLYEVNTFEATVDLIKIKRRGPFEKAGKWLTGLLKFEPGGKP